MKFGWIAPLALGLLSRGVDAACSADLKIDDYATYSSNLNSLNSWTSDDGTMTSITAVPTSKKLTFTPNSSSYFYTTFACKNTVTDGYNALTFPIKGPAGGSVTVEIQTKSGGCSASAYQSYFFTVTGLTGSTQTVTIPWTSWSGANSQAVTAFVWSSFTGGTSGWELGETKFRCAGGSTTTTTPTTAPTTTTTPTTTTIPTTTTTTPIPTSTTCVNTLIDDWISQSRLTFLGYNALNAASSDDGTTTSLVVSSNRLTLTPAGGSSYFYSALKCFNGAQHGGISLRIKAPAGTVFTIELQHSNTCSSSSFQSFYKTTTQLGWTFDGTEKLYSIPLASFSGLNTAKLMAIQFSGFSSKNPVVFGPMQLYCGTTVKEYIPPATTEPTYPTSTVPIVTGTATPFVIDTFTNPNTNSLGFWHGGDDGMTLTYSNSRLSILSPDTDYSYYTQLSSGCKDLSSWKTSYLHIQYTGSPHFTVALQQHNSGCNANVAPYPETWDVVEARRYTNTAQTDIYIPISHFNIVHSRAIGFAFKAFQQATTPTVLSKIEIVKNPPSGWAVAAKVPTAPLYFACTRPNSFAFAIDDGIPDLAQQVLQIIREENIKVTFFTVGLPLLDPGTNLSSVYTEMKNAGHQVALHTYTHPKLESLKTSAEIDWELNQDISAVQQSLNLQTSYFRPPFGNEGARSRQRLAALIPGAKVINWSVDVEDWLWASSSTPEKQLEAFQRDVNKGGNLVVLHYLYPSTVGYLRQFIQIAKATGKQLMRVDQCLQDPNAPPL